MPRTQTYEFVALGIALAIIQVFSIVFLIRHRRGLATIPDLLPNQPSFSWTRGFMIRLSILTWIDIVMLAAFGGTTLGRPASIYLRIAAPLCGALVFGSEPTIYRIPYRYFQEICRKPPPYMLEEPARPPAATTPRTTRTSMFRMRKGKGLTVVTPRMRSSSRQHAAAATTTVSEGANIGANPAVATPMADIPEDLPLPISSATAPTSSSASVPVSILMKQSRVSPTSYDIANGRLYPGHIGSGSGGVRKTPSSALTSISAVVCSPNAYMTSPEGCTDVWGSATSSRGPRSVHFQSFALPPPSTTDLHTHSRTPASTSGNGAGNSNFRSRSGTVSTGTRQVLSVGRRRAASSALMA